MANNVSKLDVSDVFGAAISGQAPSREFAPERVALPANTALRVGREYQPKKVDVEKLQSKKFLTTPKEYQWGGIQELCDNPCWLLAWDMGTGKTATIGYRLRLGIDAGNFRGPILVVCPLSVCGVWRDELKKHVGLDCVVVVGDKKERAELLDKVGLGTIVVCNYETTRTEFDRLCKFKFDAVILDEGHRVKNVSTQLNKNLRKIAKCARFRWVLTGTPSPNGPLDIFGIMTFLNPAILGTASKRVFEHRHAIYGREVSPGIRMIVGYRDLNILEGQVAQLCSRLTKFDVLKDLPPKTYQYVPVPLSRKVAKLYKQLREDAVAMLESRKGEGQLTAMNVLSESLRLLQIVGGFVPDDDGVVHPLEPNAKLDYLCELIEDIPPQPIVIWAGFVHEVDAIVARLGENKCAKYRGGMDYKQREAELADFKAGGKPFFVASYAAREGLTLVESCTTIFYSRTYNLIDWLQSQDRIHRIGQDLPVTVICLVGEDTLDEKVSSALASKTDMQDLLLRSSVSELL
mgnify:CR=1 FL=1